MSLDTDHDGFIILENFLIYFSNEDNINYEDLKKLIMDKDSKRKGKIDFFDFS
jgi:Ca2+-binding EF-hand superfamily protein